MYLIIIFYMETNDLMNFLKGNFDFKGFSLEKVTASESRIMLRLNREIERGVCPSCGEEAKVDVLEMRKVRDLDLLKPCFIEFLQARIRCRCGYNGYEDLDFLERYSRHTKRFEHHVAQLAKWMKVSRVAKYCGIDRYAVRRMMLNSLRSKRGFKNIRRWKKVKRRKRGRGRPAKRTVVHATPERTKSGST